MATPNKGQGVPRGILDDISSRFLVNLPDVERRDPIRVCFQAEEAHWFYMDFYCANKEYPNCKAIGVREFIRLLFCHCDFLKPYQNDVDNIINEWREYKSKVPTYGAIILNQTASKVLLVQGFYAKNSWGFPKGKLNEDETPENCAIREVLEEVGLDITPMINPKIFLHRTIGEILIRLYIVEGVPDNYDFVTKTRHEIRNIEWFSVQDLPNDRNDMSKTQSGIYPNHFYTVHPFIRDLNAWIKMGFPYPLEGHITDNTTAYKKQYNKSNQKKDTMAMHFTKQARNVPPRLENKKTRIKAGVFSGKGEGPSNISPKKQKQIPANYVPYARAWTNVHLNIEEIMKHATAEFKRA